MAKGGEITIVFGIGGAWKAFVAGAFNIVTTPPDLVVYYDVAGEVATSGLNLTRPDVFVISPDPAYKVGDLVDALMQDQNADAKLIGKALYGHEPDSDRGMGQTPALGDQALKMELPQVRSIFNSNILSYIRQVCNNVPRKIYVYVFYGTGGGTGRGVSRRLLAEFRRSLHEGAPEASVTIRRFVLCGECWHNCGEFIEGNAATGAAQELADAIDDPYRTPKENQATHMMAIPLAGTDDKLRNLLVDQLGAMLFSSTGFMEEIERRLANDMTRMDLGGMLRWHSVHYGEVDRLSLAATVAQQYQPGLLELIDSDHADLGSPTPIRTISTSADTTDEPRRSVEQVQEDLASPGGRDERFLRELLGEYHATATVHAELLGDQGKMKATEMIAGDLTSMRDIRLRLANLFMLADMLPPLIQTAVVEEGMARIRAQDAETLIRSHWKFLYGTFFERLRAWRSWQMATQGEDDRQERLKNAATQAREERQKLSLIQAQVAALKQFRDSVLGATSDLRSSIRGAWDVLRQIAEQGNIMRGIDVGPIDDRIVDLLWASGLPDASTRVADLLLAGIKSASTDVLAEKIFGYRGRTPADPKVLAYLANTSLPKYVAPPVGGKDSSHQRVRRFMFVPLAEGDLVAFQQEMAKIDRRLRVFPIGCGAGVFIGGLEVHWVEGDDDIVTPRYLSVIKALQADPTKFALACVPGVPLRLPSQTQ